MLGLVLGVPAYALLRERVRGTWLNCALAGSAVSVAPWLLVLLLFHPDQASIGGRPTYIDGAMTLLGLYENIRSLLMMAWPGALSGFLFRLIAGRSQA